MGYRKRTRQGQLYRKAAGATRRSIASYDRSRRLGHFPSPHLDPHVHSRNLREDKVYRSVDRELKRIGKFPRL